MLGGIYTEEKCQICGARMVDNHKDAVCCPRHKKEEAHNLIVRFGRNFKKRTTDYEQACRVLTGLRFKFDEGTYDPRDYRKSNPLGLDQQIDKFLGVKEKTLKEGSLKVMRPRIKRIQNYFGPLNVKSIGYAEIEDFLLSQEDVGDKTRSCLCSILHDFYSWLVKRKIIQRNQMPEFPTIKFSLGFRKLISKETQYAVLDEVKRISSKNPRIFIGILWLSTYINLRPSELLGILEEHVDYDRGIVHIVNHKTMTVDAKAKIIPLQAEDLEMIRGLPRGFPKMHFFRMDKGTGGRFAGTPFGKDLLYNTWKKACANLGIEGVDLYGGTRHSSTTALRQYLSFEDTRTLTGHETNKAFERYYQLDVETLREGYALTRWTTNGSRMQDTDRTKK